MLEKQIQKAILDYLRLKKIFCWKNNTVGIYRKDTGSYIPSQNVGSPDIFVVKNGQIYGLEVKTDKGRQSDSQIDWQRRFLAAGGVYLVVRSIEDVEKAGL